MLNTIFVIIGTVIGAGFASGKEIFTFFNVYGILGFLGLIISELIMGVVIYKTFCIIIKHNISSYSEFIEKILTKSKFINSVICNIINIFLLISFIIMVAGFAAYFAQELHISYIFGATFIAILCFLTFLNNIDGIVKINTYFIPFLIFIILLLGWKNLDCFTYFTYHTSSSHYNWIISSILYASYNLVILIPILINLRKYVYNTAHAKIISVITTFFLLLMSITLFCLLNYYFIDIENVELPTVYISTRLNNFFKYICGFVILGAIFTTAISSGYGFLSTLNITHKKIYFLTSFFICLLAIALSNIGFSTLLNLLYPILGFMRIYTTFFYTIFFKNTLKILRFIDISM